MKAAVKKGLKRPVELVPGDERRFEVSSDGKSLFSKRQSVRFPKEDEIVKSPRWRADYLRTPTNVPESPSAAQLPLITVPSAELPLNVWF